MTNQARRSSLPGGMVTHWSGSAAFLMGPNKFSGTVNSMFSRRLFSHGQTMSWVPPGAFKQKSGKVAHRIFVRFVSGSRSSRNSMSRLCEHRQVQRPVPGLAKPPARSMQRSGIQLGSSRTLTGFRPLGPAGSGGITWCLPSMAHQSPRTFVSLPSREKGASADRSETSLQLSFASSASPCISSCSFSVAAVPSPREAFTDSAKSAKVPDPMVNVTVPFEPTSERWTSSSFTLATRPMVALTVSFKVSISLAFV
mmetsp:Transcript_95664/g.199981  ORF Transcript_95664/g.199981 Transcript_95664/m.199981 type:complete len:254 (-) Transcript_95664:879-1640(-)